MIEEKECVSRTEFCRERDKISRKLEQHDREIAILQTLYDSIKDLPPQMSELSKQIALLKQSVDGIREDMHTMNDKVEDSIQKKSVQDKEQSKKLEELDNKSKVDFLEWIKEHWVALFTLIALIVMYLQNFL